MAKGKHPVPFRTRKLSPSAPMVLRGGPRGRVGRRRTSFAEGRYRAGSGPWCMLCCPSSGHAVLSSNGHRVICRRQGGTQWSGTVVAMAAARRAAATRPSPGALRPGGLVPRAVRRLPRGRIAAVLAVPAVGRATTTARVPRVAATGLPGAERPEGPGRPRVAPVGRAGGSGYSRGGQDGPGYSGRPSRGGPRRSGSFSSDSGDAGWSRDRDDDRRPGNAGRGSGAPSRRAGGRYDRQDPAPGDRPRRSGPPAGGAGGRFSGSDQAPVRGFPPEHGPRRRSPGRWPAWRTVARWPAWQCPDLPAGHRTRQGTARGAAAAPVGPAGLRTRGAVTVPAAGPASAAARGAVPARGRRRPVPRSR